MRVFTLHHKIKTLQFIRIAGLILRIQSFNLKYHMAQHRSPMDIF